METIIQEIHVERPRKPEWLKARVPGGENYSRLKSLIDKSRLHTVCEEARCPEYGRMLEFRHRNVHDPWRYMHTKLRLLRREDRPS